MLAEIFLPPADTTSGSAAGVSLNTDTLDEEGTITDWLAFSGDYVHKGQVLGHAEILGAVMDIAAPAAGVLHILVLVDRPLPALSLVGVVDTALDARSFTVTFAPAEPPPVEPPQPIPTRLAWTVNLATPTLRTANPLTASNPATGSNAVGAAPAAVPNQGLPLTPRPSLESVFHRLPGSDVPDAPRQPAARLPLLSRQIATPPAPPEPVVAPPNQPSPPAEPPASARTPPPAENPVSSEPAPAPEAPERTPLPANVPSSPPAPAARVRLYASPRARTLARQTGVDVISVQGSGPFGRVEEQDVLASLGAQPAAEVPASTAIIDVTATTILEPTSVEPAQPAPLEPPLPMASFVPQELEPGQALPTGQTVSLAVQADATNLMLVRERLTTGIQKRTGAPLAPSVMLAKLAALALRDHPALNARQTDRGFQIVPHVDLGLTTDTLPGQPVLVLTDAVSKDLLTLSREATAQAHLVQLGGGIPATPRAATFTIVNLGDSMVDVCTPALLPPQCAALGLGRIAPRPVVHEGQVVVRHTVFLSLSYQATGVSAAEAARFLARLAALVEDPAPLAEGLIC